MVRTMTYGVLPGYESFLAHFQYWVADDYYTIRASVMDDYIEKYEGDYTSAQLYEVVRELCERWGYCEDEAGDLASSILSTLGFEWI